MSTKTFVNGQENGVIAFFNDTEPCAVYVDGERQDNISYIPQEVTGENSVEYSSEYKKNIRTMQIDGNTEQYQKEGTTYPFNLDEWVKTNAPILGMDVNSAETPYIYWETPIPIPTTSKLRLDVQYLSKVLSTDQLNIVIAYSENDIINRTGSYKVVYPYTEPVFVDQPFYLGAINPSGGINPSNSDMWSKYGYAISSDTTISFIEDSVPSPYAPSPIQNAGGGQLLVSNAVTLNNINIGSNKLETYEGSKCLYFAIEGGKKYTISLAKCSRFSACTSGNLPKLRTPIYNRVDAGSLTPSATPTTLVVNATENLRYLIIRYYNSTTDTYSEQEILDTLSVEVDKPISVNLLGANLFDIDTVLGTMGTAIAEVRLSWEKQSDGSWYCFNIGLLAGQRLFTNTEGKQGKLTLLVNQKTCTTGTSTGLTYRIVYLDGTVDGFRIPANTEFQDYSITSSPNKTVNYIDLSYNTNYSTYIKYLMINWGDVMPYEPYRKQSVSLPSSVTVDGQEVDLRFGKIINADYITVDRVNNKVVYTKNIEKLLCTGSEGYTRNYKVYDHSGEPIISRGLGAYSGALFGVNVLSVFSNYLKGITPFALISSKQIGVCPAESNYMHFRVPREVYGATTESTDAELISLFKAWLTSLNDSGNPLYIEFCRKTPVEYVLYDKANNITTELGQQILDFVNSTQNATNIIEITSTPSVSNLSVSYAKWGGIPNANNT